MTSMSVKNTDLKIFVPITKVDAAKRLVYGMVTAEMPDLDGEICDYESSKPLYEKWSGAIAKATDGKSLGNLRGMHSKVAAGKLTDIAFDDTGKSIEICCKVVDDNEWLKVDEGVYTGFSHGGKAVKRWKDDADPTKVRYTIDPYEVSLVDLPCLAEATFQVVKADGAVEVRKFKPSAAPIEPPAPSNEAIAAKATELAKAAGDETKWADFIPQANTELAKTVAPVTPAAPAPAAPDAPLAKADSDEAWEQVWQHAELPGRTFKKKAELQAALVEKRAADAAGKITGPVTAAIAEISKALNVESAEPKPERKSAVARISKLVSIADTASAIAKALKPEDKTDIVRKGLYDVGRLASLLAELKWLHDGLRWEAISEQDGSAVPNQLKASLVTLCDVLRNLVAEETAEFMNDVPDVTIIEAAAGLLPHGHIDQLVKIAAGTPAFDVKASDVIHKVGARHSKADNERIGKAHDLLVDLGAECKGGDAEKLATGDMAKVRDDLTRMTAERDELKKTFEGFKPALDKIIEKLTNIEAQPMPGGPVRTGPVDKGLDGLDLSKAMEGVKPEDLLTLVIKAAQSQGRVVNQIGQQG
jgi:hypothetical protein